MAQLVTNNAILMCSFGTSPGTLAVLPDKRVNAGSMPAATVMDNKPMLNIKPFGMCTSIANPTVSAATAAAQGVLTPMPCMPVTNAPWTPGSPTVKVGPQMALNSTCQLMCMWAGQITISSAGQQTVNTA